MSAQRVLHSTVQSAAAAMRAPLELHTYSPLASFHRPSRAAPFHLAQLGAAQPLLASRARLPLGHNPTKRRFKRCWATVARSPMRPRACGASPAARERCGRGEACAWQPLRPPAPRDRRSVPIDARRSRPSTTPRPPRLPRPLVPNPATLACPEQRTALRQLPQSPQQHPRPRAAAPPPPRRLQSRRLQQRLRPKPRPEQPLQRRLSRQLQPHPSRLRPLQPLQRHPSRLHRLPLLPQQRPSRLALQAARAARAAAAAAATAGCCTRLCLWTCACLVPAWQAREC